MSVKVENLEKNMVKLTIEVSAEDLEKAINSVFLKTKNRIQIPGFRKGKAPRRMIEQIYGKTVFLEDAANEVIPEEYRKAASESGLTITSSPKIEAVQLEPGKPFIFSAEVAVKPEVTLGEYKGMQVAKADLDVTEEEVLAEIRREQEKNSRIVTVEDRPAQEGDTVTLDFEGFVDGTPFEGGKGTDHPLVLGSGSFIPGFEEQLVGANTGGHVEVKVTFPKEYQAAELAGKEAVFQCDIKKIEKKELPELDDEFAQDVSEFDTMDAYKESVKKTLEERKQEAAKTEKENAAVDKVIENAQMDIPDAMIETQAQQMLEDFANRMQMQGLSMEQYFQFTGQSAEKMLEDMKPQALKRIQTRLVLEKVAETEGIEISDEELEEEFKKMAESYKMEVEKVKELMKEGLETMKQDLAVQKAVTLIADSAVEA